MDRTVADGIGFKADVSTSGTSLTAATSDQLLDLVNLPDMFAAHEASLTSALRRALTAFNASVTVEAQHKADGWAISADGPAQLNAQSGLAADILPGANGKWLSSMGRDRSVAGQLSLKGGGLPALTADLQVQMSEMGLSHFNATDLKLSSWSAGGRTISADLKRIDYQRVGEGEMALETSGKIGVAGNVSGFDLDSSSLSGQLLVSSDKAGWRISTPDRSCLSLDSQGLRFGSVSLGAFRTPICPEGKDFISPGAGFAGATKLGDLVVPVAFSSNAGTVSFTNAQIDWTGGKTASVSAVSDSVSLALGIGEETLSIDGDRLRLGIATRLNAAPALSARLGATKFNGTLVPANV
ncbi:MAG TPA: hypothetical protein DHU81_03820, partial [Hyphomonas sp.]|nr:hypothetical protein [Hyphomonas sp.]